jgi:hypothetical protein
MRGSRRWRIVAALAVGLIAPFPSTVRYAPVARGLVAFAFESGGDGPVGMGYVLAASVLYLGLYSGIAYWLIGRFQARVRRE